MLAAVIRSGDLEMATLKIRRDSDVNFLGISQVELRHQVNKPGETLSEARVRLFLLPHLHHTGHGDVPPPPSPKIIGCVLSFTPVGVLASD